MADAFGQWLEHCLGDRGLVVFDAADPAAKPLAAGVFRDELLHAGRTSALAGEAGAALEALGYHAQVDRMADHVALFHLEDGRHPIRRHGPLLVAGTAERTPEQLAAVATAHPERFSPNVLLRPIVQDTLFPTVCYVGGPSELAYLGQLRGVYEAFGVPMPIVHPRVTATLLDASSRRFMTRYGLEFEALQAQDEARLNRLLEAQLPPHVEAALQAATRAVEAQMAEVIQAMPAIDPTLEGAARSALGKMDHELRSLHHKVIHAAKKRDETLRRQFNRARAQAFPGGHLQEREVGFVYFLNRYGPALVDVLAAELPLDPGYHWILTV
jgi:bacillithiol biosynthesis cysteine-adding enzyme BshC